MNFNNLNITLIFWKKEKFSIYMDKIILDLNFNSKAVHQL